MPQGDSILTRLLWNEEPSSPDEACRMAGFSFSRSDDYLSRTGRNSKLLAERWRNRAVYYQALAFQMQQIRANPSHVIPKKLYTS